MIVTLNTWCNTNIDQSEQSLIQQRGGSNPDLSFAPPTLPLDLNSIWISYKTLLSSFKLLSYDIGVKLWQQSIKLSKLLVIQKILSQNTHTCFLLQIMAVSCPCLSSPNKENLSGSYHPSLCEGLEWIISTYYAIISIHGILKHWWDILSVLLDFIKLFTWSCIIYWWLFRDLGECTEVLLTLKGFFLFLLFVLGVFVLFCLFVCF